MSGFSLSVHKEYVCFLMFKTVVQSTVASTLIFMFSLLALLTFSILLETLGAPFSRNLSEDMDILNRQVQNTLLSSGRMRWDFSTFPSESMKATSLFKDSIVAAGNVSMLHIYPLLLKGENTDKHKGNINMLLGFTTTR